MWTLDGVGPCGSRVADFVLIQIRCRGPESGGLRLARRGERFPLPCGFAFRVFRKTKGGGQGAGGFRGKTAAAHGLPVGSRKIRPSGLTGELVRRMGARIYESLVGTFDAEACADHDNPPRESVSATTFATASKRPGGNVVLGVTRRKRIVVDQVFRAESPSHGTPGVPLGRNATSMPEALCPAATGWDRGSLPKYSANHLPAPACSNELRFAVPYVLPSTISTQPRTTWLREKTGLDRGRFTRACAKKTVAFVDRGGG